MTLWARRLARFRRAGTVSRATPSVPSSRRRFMGAGDSVLLVRARTEVVPPRRDLVPGDLEDAHAGGVEPLPVDDEAVDTLRQHHIAGDREVHDLELAPGHGGEEVFDGSTDFLVAARR